MDSISGDGGARGEPFHPGVLRFAQAECGTSGWFLSGGLFFDPHRDAFVVGGFVAFHGLRGNRGRQGFFLDGVATL